MTLTQRWLFASIEDASTYVTVGYVGPQSKLFVDEGVPLLRGQNIKPFRLDLTNLKHVPEDVHRRWKKSSLQPGDVVIVRVGYPGVACVIPPGLGELNAASLVIVRPDPTILHPQYLAMVLNSPWGKERVQELLVGSAQQVLNTQSVAQLQIPLPPVSSQHAAVCVFAAIDDLIENNRRRIALLERLAQAIYREWFVHFRYPGHEADELVDSPLGPIPAGWVVVRLGDVVELCYGKALKADARNGGAVAVVGSSGVVGSHDESLIDGPAVIVGRKGNVGSVMWIQGGCWPIDTTYYVATDLPLHFAYRLLGSVEFIDSHAAVPGLSRDQAYALEVVQPPPSVTRQFDVIASELSEMSVVLDRETQVLTVLRDKLLPKLVTGAIDVSHLDLDALLEEPAA